MSAKIVHTRKLSTDSYLHISALSARICSRACVLRVRAQRREGQAIEPGYRCATLSELNCMVMRSTRTQVREGKNKVIMADIYVQLGIFMHLYRATQAVLARS